MKLITIIFFIILLIFVFSPVAIAYDEDDDLQTEENEIIDPEAEPQPDYQNGTDSQEADSDTQPDEPQPDETQAYEPQTYEAVTPLSPFINPLTGMPINTNISLNRPIAVSFSNTRAALPQHGISQADIIYEMLVEGGITRMLALFLDVSNIRYFGSLRSLRPYMIYIGYSYRAIYVHGGGSPAAMNILRSWPTLHRLDGVFGPGDRAFFRIGGRVAPHNLFITGNSINQGIRSQNIPRNLDPSEQQRLTFAADATPRQDNSRPATGVDVRFSSSSRTRFTYNSDTNRYYATIHGNIPYVDGNNNRQVAVTNVLILQMRTVNNYDREGRLSKYTTFWNWGYFINGGRAVPIYWRRPEMNSQFEFYLLDHTELVLGEGKTYICIVPALNVAPTDTHSLRLHSTARVTFISPNITIQPPANFTNPRVFLDGIEYTATSSFNNGRFSIIPGTTTRRTVTVYSYDDYGIPNGMFNWRLSYSFGAYTATAVPGLQNLLTYIGYSIRIAGDSGIRAHNSIRIDARNRLLTSGGIDGFRLREYGTLVMNNRHNVDYGYPLILSGERTDRGISFGGGIDRAFRVNRQTNQIEFTSVLVGIPSTEYKTEFLFRSYAVLRRGGRDYVFYGPPVPRSIFRVAEQVLEAEQFPIGSHQYDFLNRIIREAG